MNTHRIYRFVVALALMAGLLPAFSMPALAVDSTCAEVLAEGEATFASIDIPTRPADYAALDQIKECTAASGAEFALPATGRAYSPNDRFMEMKDRQAEMRDQGG